MNLGVVSGSIVSTIQHPFYQGRKMLLVDLCDERFEPSGKYVIAIDVVDAGVGDRVLVLGEGTGARQILDDPEAPVRAVVIGVVDQVATKP